MSRKKIAFEVSKFGLKDKDFSGHFYSIYTCLLDLNFCCVVDYRARRNTNVVVAKLATTLDKVVARDGKVVARNILALNEEKSINHVHRAFISISSV